LAGFESPPPPHPAAATRAITSVVGSSRVMAEQAT
jgi:hypothetical protein